MGSDCSIISKIENEVVPFKSGKLIRNKTNVSFVLTAVINYLQSITTHSDEDLLILLEEYDKITSFYKNIIQNEIGIGEEAPEYIEVDPKIFNILFSDYSSSISRFTETIPKLKNIFNTTSSLINEVKELCSEEK